MKFMLKDLDKFTQQYQQRNKNNRGNHFILL